MMYMCVRTFRPQNVSPLAYTFRCVKIAARRHDNGRTPKTDGREDDGENDGRFRSSSFSRLPQFFYWAKSAGKKRNVQTSEGKTSLEQNVWAMRCRRNVMKAKRRWREMSWYRYCYRTLSVCAANVRPIIIRVGRHIETQNTSSRSLTHATFNSRKLSLLSCAVWRPGVAGCKGPHRGGLSLAVCSRRRTSCVETQSTRVTVSHADAVSAAARSLVTLRHFAVNRMPACVTKPRMPQKRCTRGATYSAALRAAFSQLEFGSAIALCQIRLELHWQLRDS